MVGPTLPSGRSHRRAIAARGATMVCAGFPPDRGTELSQQLANRGITVLHLAHDASARDIEDAAAEVSRTSELAPTLCGYGSAVGAVLDAALTMGARAVGIAPREEHVLTDVDALVLRPETPAVDATDLERPQHHFGVVEVVAAYVYAGVARP